MDAPKGLAFDPVAHEYRYRGAKVPGVTSILQPLVDFSRVPPDVLDAKRDLGQRVHEACQFFDEDDLDEGSIEADVAPYLQAWVKFRAETGAKVLRCEARVFDPVMAFAGTLDRVLDVAGARYLVDLKTCIATPIAVGPQTAAYLRALGDNSVTHRAALRLRPDGTYRFDPLEGADDWSVFLSCLTLYRFKEKHS